MAVLTPTSGTTGASKAGENVGKNIHVKVLSKTNITQAELDSALLQIAMTSTIVSVGPFTAGTTDVIGIITEGPEVADDSSNAFSITGATWAAVTGF
mgnify:FL=1|jgi:hypothetical protein|tara:strand:- start:31 stop:321 length:291 start_codon:yes stop_codon:yes gene_type:complete